MTVQLAQLDGEAAARPPLFSPTELPFLIEYDLSLMTGSVEITFPKRLGGMSTTRGHKGIGGMLGLRFDESDKRGTLSVSLVKLDVGVGHIALPLRLDGAGSSSFNLVSLQLHTPDGEPPRGYMGMESGEITPLDVTLALKKSAHPELAEPTGEARPYTPETSREVRSGQWCAKRHGTGHGRRRAPDRNCLCLLSRQARPVP